jgi:uncharacterized protein YjbI with pentapeptide repeats
MKPALSKRPLISSDPMYQLLREGRVEEFNARRAQGEACNLAGHDLSRLDLRGIDARGLDLTDCYFRAADLRGVDLRTARLEGASFAGANLSGAYLPKEVSACEIGFSISHGIRVRYRQCDGS